jgi:hypothetical protein
MVNKGSKSTKQSNDALGRESDYASSIAKAGKVSSRMRNALSTAKTEARAKVIERGIVQFRADNHLMRLLLQIADEQKKSMSELCREWVSEKVQELKPGAVVIDGNRLIVHLSEEAMQQLLDKLVPPRTDSYE